MPSVLLISASSLFELGAAQVLVFDGGGRLLVGKHNAELPPGRWIIAQLADERDRLAADVLYTVPNDDAPK